MMKYCLKLIAHIEGTEELEVEKFLLELVKVSRLGENVELIAVETLTNPSVILCCVYVPPNDYCTSIINSLGSLPTCKNVIILGDFNCPDINWNYLSGSTDSRPNCVISLSITILPN